MAMVEVWGSQEHLLPMNGILTLLSRILPTGCNVSGW